MVKRFIFVAFVCILSVMLFAVPSMALVNPFLVQGEATATFFIPAYGLYAIDREYLPADFYTYASVDTPLLLFNHLDVIEAYGEHDIVYILADESLDTDEGYACGFAILECAEETLNDGTIVVNIEFCVAIYEYVDDGWVFNDILFEPDSVNTPHDMAYLYYFAYDVISDPTNVSDFFAYMYPMLPMAWPDYSKIVNGTYENGLIDGIRRGRQQINLQEINAAYERGKSVGFDEGYNEGFADAGGKNFFKELVDAVVFSPVNAIVEMMNFDFFGINVANFFLALLTILMLAGIISLVARFIL